MIFCNSMNDIKDRIETIAKQLLSLKSTSRMTKQDQQTIEDIITDTIPTIQKQLKSNEHKTN